MDDVAIICPKCHKKINISMELFNESDKQKIECTTCGLKMIVKKPIIDRVSTKENTKSVFEGLGKLCLKGMKSLVHEVNPDNMSERMADATEKLERRHVDKWDKERLERELRLINNLYEKQVIFDRLKNYNGDKED